MSRPAGSVNFRRTDPSDAPVAAHTVPLDLNSTPQKQLEMAQYVGDGLLSEHSPADRYLTWIAELVW